MIDKLILIRSNSYNPYNNQAIEASLLSMTDPHTAILYIWANDQTVFIGKNQNAYTECDVSKLEADGGFLARRITGGGAVFHDKGNLNFTFVYDRSNYSVQKQFEILLRAVKSLGIDAQLSGRNDCIVAGKKFSGNAFYRSDRGCMHHGTVLINTAYANIGRYLNVPKAKLEAKGVRSVVSRVTNLKEYNPLLDYEMVANALEKSFLDNYPAAQTAYLRQEDLPLERFQRWHAFFSDRQRIMGDNIFYHIRREHRFDWGTADIRLEMDGSIIQKAKIYTDALDTDSIQAKEESLIGLDISRNRKPEVEDIITVIGEQYEL